MNSYREEYITSPLSRSFISVEIAVAVHIFRLSGSGSWTLRITGLAGVDATDVSGFTSDHAACAAFLDRMAKDSRLKALNAATIVPLDAVRLDS